MNKKTIIPPDSAFEFNPLLDDAEDFTAIEDFANNSDGWVRHPMSKKPITIRMPGLVLEKLKKVAEKEGLKYQTLINSILTKYANTH